MTIEKIGQKEKININFIISRAYEYIKSGRLQESVISIGSDINDAPNIEPALKRVILGLVMDYKNKPDLSRTDVDTFIEYIKKVLEEK